MHRTRSGLSPTSSPTSTALPPQTLSRRQFLHLSALGFAGAALPALASTQTALQASLPRVSDLLDKQASNVLELVVPAAIDPHGYLAILDESGQVEGRVEYAQTAWNEARTAPRHRLWSDYPWAVVLHWDGAPAGPRSVWQLVNGLNHSLDITTGKEASHSAHFGVGPGRPTAGDGRAERPLGLAQLQRPADDGVPFIASHLKPDVGKAHWLTGNTRDSLAAMRVIGIRSVLQDIYWGVRFDPNYRTLAVEMNGRKYHADFPANFPPPQQLANTLTLLRALMNAYSIGPWGVLGHFELQYDKGDPGKQFMATVRFLLGVLALIEPERGFQRLMFGEHEPRNIVHAALYYLRQVEDYVRLLTLPETYAAWDHHFGFSRALAGLSDLATRTRGSRGDGSGRTSPRTSVLEL